MPNPLFRPPRHLIKEWPEVFEDLYMNTMPVFYLDLIHLEFTNGRIWSIDVREELVDNDPDSVADKLFEIIGEYKDEIKKIDFKIDVDRLKKDIIDQTKTIM
jgi:hypothetical protein